MPLFRRPSDRSFTQHLPPPPDTAGSHHRTTALAALGLVALAGAAYYLTRRPHLPAGITPVQDFDLQRYQGKWYEAARMAQRFAKTLQRTQYEYSLLPGGRMLVTHRSYDPRRNAWKVAHGKAAPLQRPDVAAWKLSFFGPLASGYHVIALDEDYRWALVMGESLASLRILSRTPHLSEALQAQLLQHVRLLGIDSDQLLWVHQDGINPTGHYR